MVRARRKGEQRGGCLLEPARSVSNLKIISFSTNVGQCSKSEQGKEGDESSAE